MPIFDYKAYAPGGAIQSGVIDADTPRDARVRLRRENLLVSEIEERRGGRRSQSSKKGVKIGFLEKLRRDRAANATPSMRNLEVLTSVTRMMGTLLSSGIPLAETLKAIIEQERGWSHQNRWDVIADGTDIDKALHDIALGVEWRNKRTEIYA